LVKCLLFCETACVISMSIEAIIGEMGTHSELTANEGVLATAGEEVTALFVRVLQDEAWREELWEQFGRPRQEEMRSWVGARSDVHPAYLDRLRIKALKHLLQWSKSREEPLRSVVNQERRKREEEMRAGWPPEYREWPPEFAVFHRACVEWRLEEIPT